MNALKDDAGDEAKELASLIGALLGYHVPGARLLVEDDEAVVGRGTAAIIRVLGMVAAKRNLVIVVENANAASRSSLTLASPSRPPARSTCLSPAARLPAGVHPAQARAGLGHLATPTHEARGRSNLAPFLTGIEEIPKESDSGSSRTPTGIPTPSRAWFAIPRPGRFAGPKALEDLRGDRLGPDIR